MTFALNQLTANELRALKVIFNDCLGGMCGSSLADLNDDPYTWTHPSVLVDAGWSKHEAAGTYGALVAKNLVSLDGTKVTFGSEWVDTLNLDTLNQLSADDVARLESTESDDDPTDPSDTPSDDTPSDDTQEKKEQTMFILTRDLNGNFAAYNATRDQFLTFETSEDPRFDELMGWAINNATDLTSSVRLSLVDGATAYTQISGNQLKKFKTKDQLQERLFDAIKSNAIDWPFTADIEIGEPSNPTPAPAPKPAKTRRKGFHNYAPLDKAYPCRANSKQANLIDALAKKEGATLDDLRAATSSKMGGKDWKDSSIFSAFGEDVRAKKGYGVRTEEVDGEPRYFLVLPEGLDAPLPHTQRAS